MIVIKILKRGFLKILEIEKHLLLRKSKQLTVRWQKNTNQSNYNIGIKTTAKVLSTNPGKFRMLMISFRRRMGFETDKKIKLNTCFLVLSKNIFCII